MAKQIVLTEEEYAQLIAHSSKVVNLEKELRALRRGHIKTKQEPEPKKVATSAEVREALRIKIITEFKRLSKNPNLSATDKYKAIGTKFDRCVATVRKIIVDSKRDR